MTFQLREDEQNVLLRIARLSIESAVLRTAFQMPFECAALPAGPGGVFVSLHRNHSLRGCIGNLRPDASLPEAVRDCAAAAALEDPRFDPVTTAELSTIVCEISVLSEMNLVRHIDEIVIGRDGLLVESGRSRGLLLPQVARDMKWTRETFVSETCRKANLPPNAWTTGARIQRFEALVFSEPVKTVTR